MKQQSGLEGAFFRRVLPMGPGMVVLVALEASCGDGPPQHRELPGLEVAGHGGSSEAGGAAGAASGPGDSPSGVGGAPDGGAGAPSGGMSGGENDGGPMTMTGTGGRGGAGTPPAPTGGCPDIFSDDRLTTYEIDIAQAEWDGLVHDFFHRAENEALGLDIHPYHRVAQLRYEGEVVTDAMIRLKGNSSWRHALEKGDQPPKMQFVISFNEINAQGRFHGVRKVELDMPRSDRSYLRQRVSLAYLRGMGLPVQCANSGRLVVNGALYGLYTHIERPDKEFLQRLFPQQDDGELWDAGHELVTKEETMALPHPRLDAFWAVADASALAAIADMDESLGAWAGEAMIADGDGYWIGRHNFFIYDHPTRGWLWVPHDLDATIDWTEPTIDPLFYWGHRPWDELYPHFLAVISDAVWRERYVDAVRRAFEAHEAARLPELVDRFAAQIAETAAADPTRPFTFDRHLAAVADLKTALGARSAFVRQWLECRSVPSGAADRDGDGFPFCLDCNDGDPAVSPAAAEICADAVDQNCNGRLNDGCP